MADWLLALAILGLLILAVIQEVQIKTIGRRYVKLEEWAEDWLKALEKKDETQTDRIAKLLVKISDMSDDYTELAGKIRDFEELLPKDRKGEIIRNHTLLQQMNDEMERGLQMEKEWNEGVASILNYGKPIKEVKNNE